MTNSMAGTGNAPYKLIGGVVFGQSLVASGQ